LPPKPPTRGATRQEAKDYFFPQILHYVYAGDTALHLAADAHQPAIVEALLNGGADARRTNKSGSTPLQLARQATGRGGVGGAAARHEQETIVALLLQSGAEATET
jgi:hypothetical protein